MNKLSLMFSSHPHSMLDCESCVFAKMHKDPFPSSISHATTSFDLLHVDLWGPYKQPCLTSATYFLTLLDDHSRLTWTHLVHSKTQSPSHFNSFSSLH